MPNWCDNSIMLKGSKDDLDAFEKKAIGTGWDISSTLGIGDPNLLDFNQFVPMPQSVIGKSYSPNGYSWVKWGACETSSTRVSETELIYYFDTAWSPPIVIMQAFTYQFPNVDFLLEYEEIGMMFRGFCHAVAGTVTDNPFNLTEDDLHDKGLHEDFDPEEIEGCKQCHALTIKYQIEKEYE